MSRRQVGLGFQGFEAHPRASAQVKVGRLVEAPTSGMPVIGEDLFTLAIVDAVVIALQVDAVVSLLG